MTQYADEERQALARALGAYELRGVIGRGGFAAVYAAYDPTLKREVAIKVLRDEVAGEPGVLRRFRREAEAVARLRHPHVIPIYAVGEGDGFSWYVMPRITGESLRARLDREHRLSVAEARRILVEAAEALGAAHAAGIVHRDIKPDNILLDGDAGRVMLSDFGIAKAPGRVSDGITLTGVVVGTPHYMSPEQAGGDRTLDHRSDLYSLGVVGYQMLTGDVPFDGPTIAVVLMRQLQDDPKPVTRLRPDCPSGLAAAIMRCLAKEPDARWSSAGAFSRAITEERASSGAIPPPAEAAPDPIRRFRWVVGGGALAIAAAAAADIALGRTLLTPLAALVAAFVVAAQYGPLWSAGYGWRDVVRLRAGARPAAAPVDSAELGDHMEQIRQARADRAGALAAIQRLPRSEQALLAGVMPGLDERLGRARGLARELVRLDRQMDPGLGEIERRLAAVRAEAASPSREQRVTTLERRRATVVALEERRTEAAAAFAAELAAITKVRFAVERAPVEGASAALPAIREAGG